MTGRQGATSANSQANWLKLNNAKHQWHPVQDPKAVAASPPLIIETGDGVYVTDIDGRRYLDCQGGLWCVNAGHGRQEIKDAITAQLDKLQYYTLFPGTTHAPSITLSAKLCEVTAEEDMAKVFFSSGGSDANETALKIARQYWRLVGEPDRTKIFSFKNGYHGLHFGATSAAASAPIKRASVPCSPTSIRPSSPISTATLSRKIPRSFRRCAPPCSSATSSIIRPARSRPSSPNPSSARAA